MVRRRLRPRLQRKISRQSRNSLTIREKSAITETRDIRAEIVMEGTVAMTVLRRIPLQNSPRSFVVILSMAKGLYIYYGKR